MLQIDLRKAKLEARRLAGYVLGIIEITYYKLHFYIKFLLFYLLYPLKFTLFLYSPCYWGL